MARDFRNNYVAAVTKPLHDVLRWQVRRIRQGLPPPPQLPTPRVNPDMAFITGNAQGRQMLPAVTWIGHATCLVQADGLNVLTDPVFSHRASPVSWLGPARALSPGLALAQLPRVDVVVISHNHYDHLDRPSIRALARQRGGAPLFLVPLGLKRWFDRLRAPCVELDWWESHDVSGVHFHFTPAQHWSARGLFDRNRSLWGAWSVLGVDCHWFFSGDTGYSRDFVDTRRHFEAWQSTAGGGGFDVALIAVGACEPRWFMREQHVDPAEAVRIHVDLDAKRSLGIHWGTFSLADEPLDHALHAIGPARAAMGVADQDFSLLAVGETCRIARRAPLIT